MKKIVLYLLSIIYASQLTYSQNINQSIERLKSTSKANVTLNDFTGIAEFVKFPAEKALALNGQTARQKVDSFLENYIGIFGINSTGR